MDGDEPQPSNPIRAQEVVEDLERKLLTPLQTPQPDDDQRLESGVRLPETPD